MRKFIRELRRREVFRSAGLYVGICWILIEGASVVLPAFDAPDVIIRFMIIAAVIGFPIMLVLAWIYDVSSKGIVVQADATDTIVVPFGSRKGDLIVIGVLSVALAFSVYLNITGGPAVVEELDPVSILIADFDNQTGDPMFDGSLEQALQIGVEGAPFVSVYQRGQAQKIATEMRETDTLNSVNAQLVAAREGINLVLVGSIVPRNKKFDLTVSAIVPTRGEIVAEADATAASKLEVLSAIGELAADLREELGDKSVDREALAVSETFTAMSLEAMRDYVSALAFAFDGKHEEAIELYRSATEEDPNFGRAFSGWALSATKLRQKEEADELWKKALSLLDTMTERERLRTLGLYYTVVTRNYIKAVESFGELVEKYPGDAAGRNNLVVVSFLTLDFQRASDESKVLLELYPNSALYRSNFALLATYSGEFDDADRVAKELIEDDPDYAVSYLAVASAAMYRGEYDNARAAYEQMLAATKSEYGESAGLLGLADVESYVGNFSKVRELLAPAVDETVAAGKLVIVAESYLAEGNFIQAAETARQVIENSEQLSHRVAAALVAIGAGDLETARAIANSLSENLQTQSRAYGEMIHASLLREQGEYIAAIEKLRSAIEMADLWLIRLQLGRAYLDAGYFAEAADEFHICSSTRIGEATAVFLDDTPTYRYLAELSYWKGRADEGFGMKDAAIEDYQSFLKLRPNGGPLADDASKRISQ